MLQPVNNAKNGDVFTLYSKGKYEVRLDPMGKFTVVSFDRNIYRDEAILQEMQKAGLRPCTRDELAVFDTQFPEVKDTYRVIAFGKRPNLNDRTANVSGTVYALDKGLVRRFEDEEGNPIRRGWYTFEAFLAVNL